MYGLISRLEIGIGIRISREIETSLLPVVSVATLKMQKSLGVVIVIIMFYQCARQIQIDKCEYIKYYKDTSFRQIYTYIYFICTERIKNSHYYLHKPNFWSERQTTRSIRTSIKVQKIIYYILIH